MSLRLTIEFQPVRGEAVLDGEFPRHFQAALYGALDPVLAEHIHNIGYPVGGRALKMIVFSDVALGQAPTREANGLRFKGPASIVVASPMSEIIHALRRSLLRSGRFRAGRQWFEVKGITVKEPKVSAGRIEVRSLSPIVAYSTLLRPDGRKYTCYFQPGEAEFSRLVAQNLERKYFVVHGREPRAGLTLEVLRVGRMVIRKFKGTVVKGWHCVLGLEGPRDLLQLALDAGLGSKNSQGWGCVDLLSPGSSVRLVGDGNHV